MTDEIERLRAERDAIQMLADDWRVRCGWARSEIETLRAERDALRAALELIADTDPDEGTAWFHNVANAALKKGGTDE